MGDSKGGGPRFLAGLKRYVDRAIVRFHTPGHRGGRWAHPEWVCTVGEQALSLDISDVLEGEVGPADWAPCLRLAEERAARLFGAAATRFLVNGTSGGIHAAVFALAAGGPTLLSRASHVSVYAATTLARSAPRYVQPVYDADWDIPGPPAPEEWARAVERERPGLVVVTYPDYYGLSLDGERLSRRLAPTPVLADEAHGAHFLFCPGSPPTALEWGAVVSVQSTHKMLAALTQASMLHVGRPEENVIPRVDRALSLFQTTSASPLLLASLESAVDQAAQEGKEAWSRAVALAAAIREEIGRMTPFRCLTEAEAVARWGARLDPVRVVVNVGDAGWTGLAAMRHLRKRWRIQAELGNQRSVVFLVTPGNTQEDAERLVQALVGLAKETPRERPALLPPPASPVQRMLPWEAVGRPSSWVPLDRSVGRIAAETICPYPPGIPVVVPGEEITSEIVEYLYHVTSRGWDVRGPAYPDLSRVAVVD